MVSKKNAKKAILGAMLAVATTTAIDSMYNTAQASSYNCCWGWGWACGNCYGQTQKLAGFP